MTTGNLRIVMAMLVATLLAAGCSTIEVRSDAQRIDVATGIDLVLPRADELNLSFDATQVISAKYENESHTFEAHIEARPGKITIVGLNTIGVILFSISYDGAEMVATGVVEAQVINAEYVLADVLLSHWDPAWLNARLDGGSITALNGKRWLQQYDEIYITIVHEAGRPWSGTTRLEHGERGYSLRIENIEYAAQ